MAKSKASVILVVFVVLGMCVPSSGFAMHKGQSYTLVVPFKVFEKKGSIWSQVTKTARLGKAADGKLVINGHSDWLDMGLPNILEGTIKKIKVKKKDGMRIFVFAMKGERIEFEVPLEIDDWESLFSQIAVKESFASPGHDDAVSSLTLPFFKRYARRAFKGPFESLSEEEKISILATIHKFATSYVVSTAEFKGVTYLSIDLGRSEVSFNDLQTNSNRRAATEISNRVFPKLREIVKELKDKPLPGLAFEMRVAHKDFTKQYSSSTYDKVQLFLDGSQARLFADYEITDQELVDSNYVLIDDNRVKLDMADKVS